MVGGSDAWRNQRGNKTRPKCAICGVSVQFARPWITVCGLEPQILPGASYSPSGCKIQHQAGGVHNGTRGSGVQRDRDGERPPPATHRTIRGTRRSAHLSRQFPPWRPLSFDCCWCTRDILQSVPCAREVRMIARRTAAHVRRQNRTSRPPLHLLACARPFLHWLPS